MSALVKKQLKAAREALGSKNYSTAKNAAEQALSFESSNYNARVFLALAQLNLGEVEESQKNYELAVASQPDTPLAYQGLLKLLESQQSWTRFREMSLQLLQVYFDAQDAQKMAEVLEKLLPVIRQHRPVAQLKEVLHLLLPSSTYFPLLSTIPPPNPSEPLASGIHQIQLSVHSNMSILEELVGIDEAEEASAIARETDKRRLRLGTGLSAEQTHRQVQSEVMAHSTLPKLYEAILEHPQATDEARRFAESKLLQHQSTLLAASKTKDATLRNRVEELSRGMVLLKIPEMKAWDIVLDWQDLESLEELDVFMLKGLLGTFDARTPLVQTVKGWLLHRKLWEPVEEDQQEDKDINEAEELISASIDYSQASLFPQVLACSFYFDLQDWDNVKAIAESALTRLAVVKSDAGLTLERTERLVSTWLATSLVYLDAPAHHRRALKILTEVLATAPDNLTCLVGLGRVHLSAERWSEAVDAFDRALKQQADNSEVKSDRAWALIGLERFDEAKPELEQVLSASQDWSAEARAQVWWRLGQCQWFMGGTHRTDDDAAYSCYISALKLSPTFAPAFTSLGLFYMDVVVPPETTRSSKCFQKALELDPREDLAARRLAEVSAKEGDWDVVEAVSRRVLAALPGRAALESGATLPSHTTQRYAWAWRAVGLADQKYGKPLDAIRALQHSLRGEPHNVGTILWLGIAYQSAGKHVAALKTFSRVVSLEPGNWVARYLAGEIQRSLGLLKPALENLEAVLSCASSNQQTEIGVQVVLSETRLALGRSLLRQGYKDRAKELFLGALDLCEAIFEGERGQRLAVKVVSDACWELGQLHHDDSDNTLVQERLYKFLELNEIDAKLTGLGDAYTLKHQRSWATLSILYAKLRLVFEPTDSFTLATSWCDLGTLLHKLGESRAGVKCLREALKRDPRNPYFWNALGVMSFHLSPRLAQHGLIRAAEYDTRSAIPWTNLGLFYLFHSDLELANKAFLKAQIQDPDYPHVWLGQAALAALHGDERERRVLISHAWMLSSGSNIAVPEVDEQFAQLPLEPVLDMYAPPTVSEALLASGRVHSHQQAFEGPSEMVRGMLGEKAGSFNVANEAFQSAAASLEKKYETTQDEKWASKYVQAKFGQSRAATSGKDPKLGVAAAQEGLGPLSLSESEQYQLRALGLLQLSLAQWHNEDPESAIVSLEESRALGGLWGQRAGLVLGRMLANLGSEEALSEARNTLLSLISEDSGDMGVITTLSALAIIQRDEELLSAALGEIEKTSAEERSERDPDGQVDKLLVAHHLLRGDTEAAVKVLVAALHRFPQSTQAKLDLARLLLDTDQWTEARGLLGSEEEFEEQGLEQQEYSALWCWLSARAAQQSGNEGEAQRLASKAVHLQPHWLQREELRTLSGISK